MRFDLPTERTAIIKVIGVGGGGSNAVNHMFNQGIEGVDFIVCNTDQQALDISPVPVKIQLGSSLTDGRGAGSIAEVGENAAIENLDEIKDHLANTKMVFVTAGMGGGTGTGAAPIIAQTARELGILTVGIVTIPFAWEGRKRKEQAEKGLEKMRSSVDTLLVICNDRLREMFGNLDIDDAFEEADNVLKTAAKGIAEVITKTGKVNVDFEDVKTVMKESGVAIMGSATSEGEGRAIKSVQEALASPLLNDNDISGARYVLLNITYGSSKVLMDEISDITDYIQDEAGSTADVIWGHGYDESLGEKLNITIIATGFNTTPDTGFEQEIKRNVRQLDEDLPTMITKPIESPIEEPVAEQDEEVNDEPFLKSGEENEELQETPEIKFEVTTPITDEPNTPQPKLNVDEAPEEEEYSEAVESSFTEPMKFGLNTSSDEELPNEEKNEEIEVTRYYLDDDVDEEAVEGQADAEESEPHNSEIKWGTPEATEVESQADTQPVSKSTPEKEEEPVAEHDMSPEEQQRLANERIARIKELSAKLKTPSGLSDLEDEPAYKRRNIELDETTHSTDSDASRFSLNTQEDEDGEEKTGLRDNNSFLHDNVD